MSNSGAKRKEAISKIKSKSKSIWNDWFGDYNLFIIKSIYWMLLLFTSITLIGSSLMSYNYIYSFYLEHLKEDEISSDLYSYSEFANKIRAIADKKSVTEGYPDAHVWANMSDKQVVEEAIKNNPNLKKNLYKPSFVEVISNLTKNTSNEYHWLRRPTEGLIQLLSSLIGFIILIFIGLRYSNND